MKELSVIIPVLNERENIAPLISEVEEALSLIDYEVIFVDDGSTDGTQKAILQKVTKRITLIEFKKNYGQSTALTAGIDHASGKYIALLDGDLQNDPSDINLMLKKLKEGDWDVVAGNRKDRKDGMIFRKIPSKI